MLRDNLTQAEKDSLKSAGKGRVVKKSFLGKGVWRCLLSVVKSRLTGASCASDIAIAQIVLMNGLRNGVAYDWASLLADRTEEFMTLQYKKFYLPHHAIGLFLDAVRT